MLYFCCSDITVCTRRMEQSTMTTGTGSTGDEFNLTGKYGTRRDNLLTYYEKRILHCK